VAQLATFSEALLEYHQQCTEVLRGLTEILLEKYVIENYDNNYTTLHYTEYFSLLLDSLETKFLLIYSLYQYIAPRKWSK